MEELEEALRILKTTKRWTSKTFAKVFSASENEGIDERGVMNVIRGPAGLNSLNLDQEDYKSILTDKD